MNIHNHTWLHPLPKRMGAPAMQASRRIAAAVAAVLLPLLFGTASCSRYLPVKEKAKVSSMPAIPSNAMCWWYAEPAAMFSEALPLGTGRLAAMVHGGISEEVIPFNDETLWSGGPYNPNNPEGLKALPEMRQAILAGEHEHALNLSSKFLSRPTGVQHYQPLGSLHVNFEGHENAADYRRELDMDSGLARVVYRVGDTTYAREVLASYPDQVLVVRLTCSRPGALTCTARLDSPQPSARTEATRDSLLRMAGETVAIGSGEFAVEGRMRWESRLRVVADGESARVALHTTGGDSPSSHSLEVRNADAATLIVCAATNHRRWNDLDADPAERCERFLSDAPTDYDRLLERHLDDYQPLFRACDLDLGGAAANAADTSARLERLRAGGADPHFIAQYFHYGRYLLLTASRAGTLAYNNHNIWLDRFGGGWGGRWTLNINIQECYWPTEVCNLPETNEALVLFTEQLAEAGRRTARELYGCDGWAAHHGTDVWMNTAPTDGSWGVWPMSGPWLLQQLWEHYLFDPDSDYLRRIYPLMRGAADFYMDFLIENPDSGWLVTCPSTSPENGFVLPGIPMISVTQGPTMDNQLLRDLLANCAEAAETLGVDEAMRKRWLAARAQLPPDQVGRWGQLQEWLYDWDRPEDTHRHVSHLYGLYPSAQITLERTPRLAEAARVSLDARGDALGWSGAWKINLWARLREPDRAADYVRRMATSVSLHPGPEDSDRVPSFEGNQAIQGVTAGIAEMLLQSHQGEIHLLPALPAAWPDGTVQGLRARGGWEVDLSWRGGRLHEARLRATRQGSCRVRYDGGSLSLERRDTETEHPGEGLIEFPARSGDEYLLTAR